MNSPKSSPEAEYSEYKYKMPNHVRDELKRLYGAQNEYEGVRGKEAFFNEIVLRGVFAMKEKEIRKLR